MTIQTRYNKTNELNKRVETANQAGMGQDGPEFYPDRSS